MTRKQKIEYLKAIQRGEPMEGMPQPIERFRKTIFWVRRADGTKEKAFEQTIKLPPAYSD